MHSFRLNSIASSVNIFIWYACNIENSQNANKCVHSCGHIQWFVGALDVVLRQTLLHTYIHTSKISLTRLPDQIHANQVSTDWLACLLFIRSYAFYVSMIIHGWATTCYAIPYTPGIERTEKPTGGDLLFRIWGYEGSHKRPHDLQSWIGLMGTFAAISDGYPSIEG